jgi:hypothetical protein
MSKNALPPEVDAAFAAELRAAQDLVNARLDELHRTIEVWARFPQPIDEAAIHSAMGNYRLAHAARGQLYHNQWMARQMAAGGQ